MPCSRFKERAHTRRSKFILAPQLRPTCFDKHGDAPCPYCDEVIPDSEDWFFFCGEEKIETCKVCNEGFAADLLCDYPIGEGKTCDLPMCTKCAREIGEDRHLCELHYHEFVGKAKVERIFPIGCHIVK